MARKRVVKSEEEVIDMMVAALKKVPAKSLLLIELANRIPIKDGELDRAELAKVQPEVNLALAEATSYGTQTLQLFEALINVPPKGGF
jgi:hypothetical protein